MNDMLEIARMQRLVEINTQPKSRQALAAAYGRVLDTEELRTDFEVTGFMARFVGVRRKSDGQKGSLEFQHNPRFYIQLCSRQAVAAQRGREGSASRPQLLPDASARR